MTKSIVTVQKAACLALLQRQIDADLFNAETAALIEGRQTPETRSALEKKCERFVTLIERQGAFGELKNHFMRTLAAAAQNPTALYRFFHLYNYFNGGIAPSIAPLLGHIGQSRDLFLDASIPVAAEASYAFAVARLVQTASTDEYADPTFKDMTTGQALDHRRLSDGLMKAVGDYAGLTTEERNAFEIPLPIQVNQRRLQRLYEGKANNLSALAQALGMHFMSEYSADVIEFSNACKLLFIDNANHGLHRYLQEHPHIAVGNNMFHATYWLQTHGGWDAERNCIKHGAEYVHLVTGFGALALIMSKAPEEQKPFILKNFILGVRKGEKLLSEFFILAEKECRITLAAQAEACVKPVANKAASGSAKLET